MEKIKVVWICHFSNPAIRKELPLSLKGSYTDFAPWISNLITEFVHFKDIELHIISPFTGLKWYSYNMKVDGICYYFYNPTFPFRKRSYLQRFYPHWMIWSKKIGFLLSSCYVHKLTKQINPDIINLIGAENPYYSATIIGVKGIPLLVTTQTVYSNPIRKNWTKVSKKRLLIEQAIFRENKYYAVNAGFMPDLIRKYQENAIFFRGGFPKTNPSYVESDENKKIYDFVFYASLAPNKGGTDLLKALAMIKKNKPDVSLLFIGIKKGNDFSDSLEKLARELNLESNIVFMPRIDEQDDLWKEVVKAKINVLPTKIDTIPGTIYECMWLGLPVISYKTGDIPKLNEGGVERVLLADKENIEQLAGLMGRLLNDKELQRKMTIEAKKFLLEKAVSNDKIARKYVDIYKAVIEHNKNHLPIPEFLLLNK